MAADSIVKLKEVMQLAVSLGVYIGPVRFICQPNTPSLCSENPSGTVPENSHSVLIFPLYSWYHSGWDTEPAVTHPESLRMEKAIPFQSRWGDFNLCSWPKEIVPPGEDVTDLTSNSLSLALAFAALNEPFLPTEDKSSSKSDETSLSMSEFISSKNDDTQAPMKQAFGEAGPAHSPPLSSSATSRKAETIISFSHFVPRTELCPEKRFLLDPKLSAVIGSDPLEQQIRRLQPHVHLFGHTHIPIDLTLDGITYIQWPLGYYR